MGRVNITKPVKEEPLEKQLWKAADKLRKNIDAAEYTRARARFCLLMPATSATSSTAAPAN